MNNTEIEVKFTEHEHEISSLKHRMKKAEEVVDAIHSLTVTTAQLAQSVEYTNQEVRVIKDKLSEITEEPSRNWKNLKTVLITSIASGLVGLLIGVLTKLL